MNAGGADADRLAGAVVGGRYQLVRKLGEGGMGAVYEARDASLDRFAVKVIHPEIAALSATAVQRFQQEARATASLDDPHVVRVQEVGHDEGLGVHYLVMEYLTGGDVDALFERVGPLDPAVAVRIALDAALGLAAAHEAGIVHRDVKPPNLFLDQGTPGRVVVKVCDFGIAKAALEGGGGITRTGNVLGSPLYMSPEQARSSKHVDARADVYSLGVTLYQLLAGVAPHQDASSLAELVTAICTKDAPHLQDVAPWIDPELCAAVHGAVLRDPAARWDSMRAFAHVLRPHAAPELTADRLTGVSPDLRARAAPRAMLPERVHVSLPSPASERDPLLGSTLAGRYRLEAVLGRGGMGAVYRAVDPSGRAVAVKVILDEAQKSGDARRRFAREARAATGITSEHVVEVLDVDADGAVPFFVMRLVAGKDLDHVIEHAGALEPTIAARIFSQACAGLRAAHERALVHRDIKPGNLFLDETPEGLVVVKIGDFGIAKSTATEALSATTAALTKTGGMLGSPVYMSPEQAKNAKTVDARSDLWSLSVSLYEALSGQRPWAHCTTIGELILAICTEDMPSLDSFVPGLDPGFAAVVSRGLVRDPAARWSSAAELQSALAPYTGGSDRITREELAAAGRPRVTIARGTLADGSAATVLSHPPATLAASAAPMSRTLDRAPGRARRPFALVAAAAALCAGLGTAGYLRSRSAPAPQAAAPDAAGVDPATVAASGSGATVTPTAAESAPASPAPRAVSAPAPATAPSAARAAPRASTSAEAHGPARGAPKPPTSAQAKPAPTAMPPATVKAQQAWD